jgi:Tol biopolymer transport system component
MLVATACSPQVSDDARGKTVAPDVTPSGTVPDLLAVPGETRFGAVRQLTFEGENAEAYFSADGGRLIFQSTHGELKCDQIFTMKLDGSERRMVSTGKGRTTCSYFLPDGSRIIYASTHLGGDDCPPPAPRGAKYVWAVYPSFDIFSVLPDASDLRRLTDAPGYDAEATVSPDGSRILFTSARDGDLELYEMRPDGSGQRRLTQAAGYDGGAFYSPDSKRICFRASRPADKAAEDEYRNLLAMGLVEPTALEIYVMDADGANLRQVTRNGAANFCPFFHPSGRKLIYSSNKDDPRRRNFDLYLVDLESGAEERVTFHETFDGFPMFSPDGKKLVWASNRNNQKPRDTNIFLADWIEN